MGKTPGGSPKPEFGHFRDRSLTVAALCRDSY